MWMLFLKHVQEIVKLVENRWEMKEKVLTIIFFQL